MFLGCSALTLAQDGPAKPKHSAPAGASVALAKVTRSDARAVLSRMEQILSGEIGLKGSGPVVTIPRGSGYVTRHEVIGEFGRLFAFYEPHFKLTPPKVKYDPSMLTVAASDKATVEKLIRWGAVAKQGPIASASVPTLTVHQFGDAVGFFTARIESLTNLPPSKWTPYLNGGRE